MHFNTLQSIDIEAVQKALGPRLYETLCASSEQFVTLVDMAAQQIFDAGQKLNRALRDEFLQAKVISGFGPCNADDAKSLPHGTDGQAQEMRLERTRNPSAARLT
jgi:hypothetical protein